MKKKVIVLILVLILGRLSYAQPDWAQIKTNFNPGYDTSTFAPPILQAHVVGGWEDGIYITRDGLHMYAFYSPVDLMSYVRDIDTTNTTCEFPVIAPYWRGPMLGVDTAITVGGCNHWLHSDIVYTFRNNLNDGFTSWDTTDIDEIYFYEGAPQIIDGQNGYIDVFLYTRATAGYDDIYIMRNVTHNPEDTGQRIDTINIKSPSGAETNPHMEHIYGSTYVLFFDDTYFKNPNVEVYYSISNDSGYSWSLAQPVTSINSLGIETMPHLWYDGSDWWLYYATNDPGIVGNDERLHIVRRKQTIKNDWNSWGSAEIVISPGFISGGYGQVFGVGEPTLTQWGDISFSVVYGDTNSLVRTDMFDSDPWILPKKGSPLLIEKYNLANQLEVKIYQNSLNDQILFQFNKRLQNGRLRIYNNIGQISLIVKEINKKSITIDKNQLSKGFYLFTIDDERGLVSSGKVIIE